LIDTFFVTQKIYIIGGVKVGLGLKQGIIIELSDHDTEWEKFAAETIKRLWHVFGAIARDIQHVGSTAIKNIKAKPIIDIAIGVNEFDKIEALTPRMEQEGFIVKYAVLNAEWCGFIIYADSDRSIRIYNVHVVKYNSEQWQKLLLFRDYMNANPSVAKKYETLKLQSAEKCNNTHSVYKNYKHDFIQQTLNDALIWMNGRNE
jgi:GrpB-like predicted nucleotidyltransferase (UPF0157 family)